MRTKAPKTAQPQSGTIGDAISGGVTLSGSVESGISRAAGGIVKGANSDLKEVGGGVGNVVDDTIHDIYEAGSLLHHDFGN